MAEMCSQPVFSSEFVTQTSDASQGLMAPFAGQTCVSKSTDVGLPQHKLTRGYQVYYLIMKNVVKEEREFLDLTPNFRLCSQGLKGFCKIPTLCDSFL